MKKYQMTSKDQSYIALIGIFLIYLVMSSSAINEQQMMYGDMDTLYYTKKLTDGKRLYQELPILYGPLLYLTGSVLMSFGATYSGLKIFMLAIALTSGFLVFLISNRTFKDHRISILSTAIYMFLPIHYGVAPMFHADSFAVLFLLISLYFLTINKNIGLILSGIFASLAVFSKIPAIPLTIIPIVYFLICKKKEGLLYLIPFFTIVASTLSYISSITRNSDNISVIFNYLIKNPNPPYEILRDFVWIEGFAFIASAIGIFLYLKAVKQKYLLPYVAISSTISFGAILVRGVGVYEANYMEPFIAIFAAFAIFYLKDNLKVKQYKMSSKSLSLLFIIIIFSQFIIFIWPDRERVADWHGDRRTKEENKIAIIHSELLKKFTSKGDVVVASPMAVYRTDRTLPLNDANIELLQIKYELGYQTSNEQIKNLKNMLENKEIKMLITFNSSKLSSSKYAVLQNQLFFPFYLDSLNRTLTQNYEKFEESGVYYFKPRS